MPDPEIEKSSDVIVKIGAAGYAGPTFILLKVSGAISRTRQQACRVMGHENAGWIEEVGKDVTGFKRVTLSFCIR